jgi:hypothetical protein
MKVIGLVVDGAEIAGAQLVGETASSTHKGLKYFVVAVPANPEPVIVKVTYAHYRVPNFASNRALKRRGRTPVEIVRRFRRSDGWELPSMKGFEPLTYGGMTRCTVHTADGQVVYGTANCSLQQNFDYGEGRNKAYNDAMEHLLLEGGS